MASVSVTEAEIEGFDGGNMYHFQMAVYIAPVPNICMGMYVQQCW